MKKFLPIFLFFVFCASPALSQQAAIVIQDVTLIDGTGKPPVGNVTILIEGERIRYVGPSGVDVRERASTMGVYRPLLSVACC